MSLDAQTRRVLEEVALHSDTRTGKVARAIEAGLCTLTEGTALSALHCQSLEKWVPFLNV